MAYATLSVEHETTVTRVADELRRALFDGELEPGAALREVALAEALDVSRSTVREALAVLVGDGLALRVPNRGTTVRETSAEAIADVTAARTVLETAGVRAWPGAGEERQQAVRDALAAYVGLVDADAASGDLNEGHLAIHRSLVALTGSARLVAAADSLYGEVRLALATVDRSRRNAREMVRTHTVLVELLDTDDVDGAVAELERHLAHGQEAMLEALDLHG